MKIKVLRDNGESPIPIKHLIGKTFKANRWKNYTVEKHVEISAKSPEGRERDYIIFEGEYRRLHCKG